MNCEKTCCHCDRMTERSAEEQKKLINRLSRIEGQIRGLRGMIERDAYCADILTQSAAAVAAMYALLVFVLRLAPVISELNSVSAGVNAAFFALMVFSLLLYDRLLNPLMILYAQRLRPRLKFL